MEARDIIPKRRRRLVIICECNFKEFHNEHKALLVAPDHYNKRLCTTLFDKEDYVVHSRNLIYDLEKGMTLKSISRVNSFKQQDYMKEYIEFNTQMRAKSKSDFEKDFYKLMNNSVFGKTMENVRNRVDIKLGDEEFAIKQ